MNIDSNIIQLVLVVPCFNEEQMLAVISSSNNKFSNSSNFASLETLFEIAELVVLVMLEAVELC